MSVSVGGTGVSVSVGGDPVLAEPGVSLGGDPVLAEPGVSLGGIGSGELVGVEDTVGFSVLGGVSVKPASVEVGKPGSRVDVEEL